MGAMFSNCSSLTTLDLSSFNTANVENMGTMFLYCSNLAVIYVGAGWSTASVVDNGGGMFVGCEKLPGYDENNDNDVTYAHSGDGGYLNKMALTAHEGATGEYWTTFYNKDKDFIAPTETKVFKVELSGTKLTMYEVEDRIVNRYMPVVLKSTSSNIVMTVSASSAGDSNTNHLSGWAGPGNRPADGNMYVLNKGSQGIGFYKLKDGKSLSPGKAFLYYSGSGGAREFFGFDEATGIDATLMNSEKVNSEVYDLQGRRVAQPTKGLYIVNGKKVVIK
jgi:surface protein